MDFLKKIFGGKVSEVRPFQEPLIDVSSGEMTRVYWLTRSLEEDPKHVEIVRALTLNRQKPFMGLKGTMGLFASSEWWNNINQGVMPLKFVSGTVVKVYEAGQDRTGRPNNVQLKTSDGTLEDVGIYLNDKKDARLFRVGVHVELVYALDELKSQPDRNGGTAYSEVALEMAVSTNPKSAA